MAGVPDVHDLLRWANRSEVAREITRRGYRVSVETLNRWHRDRKEVPAVVERIVFEMFGVGGHNETPPPWAEALQARVDEIHDRQDTIAEQAIKKAIGLLTPLPELSKVDALIDRLEELARLRDEAPGVKTGSQDPGGTGQPDPVDESRRNRVAET